MNFSELPPSRQWAALKYRGEKFAEVWFKPEGHPYGLTFRIPPTSFQSLGLDQRLTADSLLKAVGLAPEQVESWHQEGTATDASLSDLAHPLPPPREDAPHLVLHVSLKQHPQPAAAGDSQEPEIPEETWQDLETRWKAILELEGSMDTLRISMEGLRAEMESASRMTLSADQKGNALNADVALWNKAKSRVVYAIPKVRDFIHRSTWATATPERKQLEELFQTHLRSRAPIPDLEKVRELVENLFKDRQVMYAHGMSAYQDCKGVAAEAQGALRTLQSNAAANAAKKRGAAARGKSF